MAKRKNIEAIPPDVALHFRNEFREARYDALNYTDGYQRILFAVERLGAYLTEGQKDSLSGYEKCINDLVRCYHHFGKNMPSICKDYHAQFGKLYEIVMTERNDALHQGAFAKILTYHLIQLSITLEDSLMTIMVDEIKNYMTRNPICAHPWQPVSFVRQMMLENSFSYIPIYVKKLGKDEKAWYIISDSAIAHYLRSATKKKDRTCLLSRKIECAFDNEPRLAKEKAVIVSPKCKVGKALERVDGPQPILVKQNGSSELLGIATPFDLM